jgi:hypothetical protein
MRFSLEASVARSVRGAREERAYPFEAKASILAREMRIRFTGRSCQRRREVARDCRDGLNYGHSL